MDSCIISASELFQRAKEILNDGNTHVEIQFIESDGEMPDSIGFEAWRNGSDFGVGYDPIESLNG